MYLQKSVQVRSIECGKFPEMSTSRNWHPEDPEAEGIQLPEARLLPPPITVTFLPRNKCSAASYHRYELCLFWISLQMASNSL